MRKRMGGRGMGTLGRKNGGGGGNVRRGGGMETRGSRFLNVEAGSVTREMQSIQGGASVDAANSVNMGNVPVVTVGVAEQEWQNVPMDVEALHVVDEFDIGRKMMEISAKMREGVERILAKLGEQDVGAEELKVIAREGLRNMVDSVEAVMNVVGDRVQHDRKERDMDHDRLDRMEVKLKEVETKVEAARSARDRGVRKESVQLMKDKITFSNRQLKFVDIDYGRQTNDKREIIDKTIGYMREDVNISDRKRLDILIRRTKFIVLGKGTVARTLEGQQIYSVPVLLELRTEADKVEMEDIMRSVHWYSVYHWPVECVEFVKEARSVIRGDGHSNVNSYVKIRPEEREGRMQIKAEVKERREGAKFRLVAVWEVPPADKDLWDRGTFRYKSFGGGMGGQ